MKNDTAATCLLFDQMEKQMEKQMEEKRHSSILNSTSFLTFFFFHFPSIYTDWQTEHFRSKRPRKSKHFSPFRSCVMCFSCWSPISCFFFSNGLKRDQGRNINLFFFPVIGDWICRRLFPGEGGEQAGQEAGEEGVEAGFPFHVSFHHHWVKRPHVVRLSYNQNVL